MRGLEEAAAIAAAEELLREHRPFARHWQVVYVGFPLRKASVVVASYDDRTEAELDRGTRGEGHRVVENPAWR